MFKARFPALADLYHNIIEDITEHGDEKNIFSFWKVMPAKNGSLTAQIDNMLLHSSYNPEREAISTASQLESKNKECVIFMGAGLGWQFCALAKLIKSGSPVKKLVLVEPDPLHFFGALFYVDWSQVFAVEALVIALGCPPDSLMGLLEGSNINVGNSGLSASYVYAIPSFIQHARAYFDSVITLIERNRSKNDINAATYKKFEKLWIKNSLKNLEQTGKRRSLKDFAADYCKKPGPKDFLLIAAGPSLQKVLPKIGLIKKRAVLVCVETALHALLKAGIEPDFIVITDPQYYAYKHIAGLKAPSSILVCPLSVYPAVFRFKCRQILLCSELFPVSSYFEKELGAFGDLGAGGSVASSAWNLCRMLGAQNIYFAGLDLSYPEGQTHIKGSSAEQTYLYGSNRLLPVQASNSSSRFSANPEYSFDYRGRQILTDARMKMFAWWFESQIAAHPQVKNFTLCSSSMKIPGVDLAENFFEEEWCPSPAPDREDIASGSGDPATVSAVLEPQSGVLEPAPAVLEPVERPIDAVKASFFAEVKSLTALVNQAVEACIIGGPELETKLLQIEAKIAASPLAEIIRLAYPQVQDKLQAYRQLQKTMELYKNE